MLWLARQSSQKSLKNLSFFIRWVTTSSRILPNAGDFGSFLIDRFGCVCGLLYGTTYTYAGINLTTYAGAGLAMTMPDAMETIRLKIHHNILQ